MKQSNLLIGIIGISASIILLIIALLANGGGMGWMGGHMMDGGGSLSSEGLIVVLIAVIVLIASIIFLTFSAMNKKEPQTIAPMPQFLPQMPAQPVKKDPLDDHQISKLLNGDERNLYQMIASTGGEILQKDLVAKNVFSKAKVTRLLDKLEERGVIIRERYGMTNRIRLVK